MAVMIGKNPSPPGSESLGAIPGPFGVVLKTVGTTQGRHGESFEKGPKMGLHTTKMARPSTTEGIAAKQFPPSPDDVAPSGWIRFS